MAGLLSAFCTWFVCSEPDSDVCKMKFLYNGSSRYVSSSSTYSKCTWITLGDCESLWLQAKREIVWFHMAPWRCRTREGWSRYRLQEKGNRSHQVKGRAAFRTTKSKQGKQDWKENEQERNHVYERPSKCVNNRKKKRVMQGEFFPSSMLYRVAL